MWFDDFNECAGCPFEDICNGDGWFCPRLNGDGHPDDYGDN